MGKKRKDEKYPNLVPRLNSKKRQDYMDNHYYVKNLPEEAKQYLNDFNGEYYVTSFDDAWEYDNIHKCELDKETVLDLKAQIKVLKAAREKIWNKSANTTTDSDRELALYFTGQIDEIYEFLHKNHPRMELEKESYRRKTDLINHGKACNEFRIVSWETLDDNMLGDLGPEYNYNDEED